MAILRLSADGRQVRLRDTKLRRAAPEFTREDARRAAPGLAQDAPIVMLVHGFMFDPFVDAPCDPHDFLFHFDEGREHSDRFRRPASWPRGLGFTGEADAGAEGLCVGFGWAARGSLPQAWMRHRRRFCLAFDDAAIAGEALANAVRELNAAFPGRKVDILCHSLGARVALAALRDLGPTEARLLGRILLLNPAEFGDTAREAVQAVGAAAMPECYAISARENSLFDRMLEALAPGGWRAGRASIGRAGVGLRHRRWIDLQIDSPTFQDWIGRSGLDFDGRARFACHWGVYSRPGAMALYRRILREREHWGIAVLRAGGVPESQLSGSLRMSARNASNESNDRIGAQQLRTGSLWSGT